ncbi:MAG: EAL domain-containing protein [Roseibium sp.]
MSEFATYLVNYFGRLKRTHVDALVISFLSLSLWLVAVIIDLYESIGEFLSTHEDWELDELVIAFTVAGLGGFVFGVRRYMERERELVLRKKAEARSTWLAQHDPLTHLPNRRYLKTLSKNIRNGSRVSQNLAVLAVDLDGFKKVNDLLGHDAGDALLKIIANRLKDAFPDSTVLRLGGDEFLVVTTSSEVSVAEGWQTVNNLIKALNEPADLFGVNTEVGASIGIALMSDCDDKIEDLARSADAALYHAKRTGRNNAAFYEPFMGETLKERASNQSRIRNAIKDGELVPHYQPILDLASHDIIGAEILTRWPTDEDDSISPKEIIEIAEELGLVISFSEQLLRQAIQSASDWPQEQSLFYNLAPTMLADKLLASRIATILSETGFAAHRLTVEVPEHALHNNKDTATAILTELKTLGVRIALDGFGGGQCNLVELAKMPIDLVKLDRALLTGASSGQAEKAVLETYFAFAHALGRPVVAIGVETKDQQAYLSEIKCDFAQGFLYSPAISEVDFRAQLSIHGNNSAT